MSSYRHAPLSTGHDYKDPPGIPGRLYDGARHVYQHHLLPLLATARSNDDKKIRVKGAKWQPKSILSLPVALILVWVFVLWWGEVGTFRRKVNQCDWQYWERWVSI